MNDSPSRRSDNDEPQEWITSLSDHVDDFVSLNKNDCEHQQASFQQNDIITPEKKHADVRSSSSSELLLCKKVTPPVHEKKRLQSEAFTSTSNTDDKKDNTNPSTHKTFTNAKTKILDFDSFDKKLKTNHTDNINTHIGKDRDLEEVNSNRYHNKQRPATECYSSHHTNHSNPSYYSHSHQHHHSYRTQYHDHHPGSSAHPYPYQSHHSSHPEYNTMYDTSHTFHPGPSNNYDHINYYGSKNYNNYHSHPSSHQHHHAYPSSSYYPHKNSTTCYNHHHQYNYNHSSSYHDSSYPCQQAYKTSYNHSYNKNRPSLHEHQGQYHYQPSYYEHNHSSHDHHPEMRQTKNTKLNLMEAPSRHAPTPPRRSGYTNDNKLTGEIPESITIQKQTTTQPNDDDDDDDDDDGLTFSSSFSTALLPRDSTEYTLSSNKNLIPSVSYYDQTSSSSEGESPTKKCDSSVVVDQGESQSTLFGDGLQSIGTISFDSMLSSFASVAMCFPCNDTPDDTVLPPLPCPSYNNNTASILHQSNIDRNTKRQKLLPTPSAVAVAVAGRKTTSKSSSSSSSSRPRKECRISGCSNRVVQGGVCIQHGARRKICSFPGCTKHVKKAGRCSTHGPARKRCNMESCTNVAVQGGRCIAHGAKKKKCCIAGCSKQAILSGMCKRHYDQHHIVIQRYRSPSCEVFSSEGVNQGDVKEYGEDSRCYQEYPSQKEDKVNPHRSEFGYI